MGQTAVRASFAVCGTCSPGRHKRARRSLKGASITFGEKPLQTEHVLRAPKGGTKGATIGALAPTTVD
jgi:hypothetical protein